MYEYSYANTGNTVTDNVNNQVIENSTTKDNTSYTNAITVKDKDTNTPIYNIAVLNNKIDITYTTNIQGSNTVYLYEKDALGRLYKTAYGQISKISKISKTDTYGGYGEVVSTEVKKGAKE